MIIRYLPFVDFVVNLKDNAYSSHSSSEKHFDTIQQNFDKYDEKTRFRITSIGRLTTSYNKHTFNRDHQGMVRVVGKLTKFISNMTANDEGRQALQEFFPTLSQKTRHKMTKNEIKKVIIEQLNNQDSQFNTNIADSMDLYAHQKELENIQKIHQKDLTSVLNRLNEPENLWSKREMTAQPSQLNDDDFPDFGGNKHSQQLFQQWTNLNKIPRQVRPFFQENQMNLIGTYFANTHPNFDLTKFLKS